MLQAPAAPKTAEPCPEAFLSKASGDDDDEVEAGKLGLCLGGGSSIQQ